MTKGEARQHALLAVVEILRNYGFGPDDREFPNQSDRDKIMSAYSEINAGLEAKLNKSRTANETAASLTPLRPIVNDDAQVTRVKDLIEFKRNAMQ